MSADRHARTKECFLAALELGADERESFLTRLRAEDAELCTEVCAMLEFDGKGAGFLDHPPPAHSLGAPQPERIGSFRVLREIGAGGMGTVYEAEQDRPHRRVALKVLGAGMLSPRFARRFEFEGELLARLSHPGIAQIFETGTSQGPLGPRPYIAMELVPGLPLTQYAEERGLDRSTRVELLARVADAVEHAHRRGVIHRDLKPANILVDAEGQPKVLDFGIGRALDPTGELATLATEAGQILGTLQYMSPEQALGASETIDTRADVYALGVLLHELLAGTLPYETSGKPLHEALRTVITAEPARLSAADRTLAGDIEHIVAKALAKEPERRYGSAGALAEDLRRHLAHEPILAQPPTRVYRLRKFVRRHRALVAGAAATFAVLVLGLLGTGWQAFLARGRAREAREAADTAQAILKHLLLDPIRALDPRELGSNVKASEVFERVEEHIEGSFSERPLIEAAVRDALGTVWRALGEPERAEPLLARALDLRRGLLGTDESRTLETMEHLASCLADLGRPTESLALCEEVYARRSTLLGARHPTTLVALNDLAAATWSLGRTTEGLERMREAIALRERELGPGHEDTLSSKSNLAVMLDALGRFAEAEPIHDAVLAAHRARLGEEHPDVLRLRTNLAFCQERQGRLADPEATWRVLLAGHERTYGADHPLTARAMLGLAAALAISRRPEQAEPLYRTAHALLAASFGSANRDVLGAARELARFLERNGRADEALEMMEGVVAVERDGLPEGHYGLVISLNFYGQSLRRAGRLEEALAAFEEAIETARASADVSSDALSQCLYNEGVLLRSELARPADAVPELAEALELDRAMYPEGNDVLAGDIFHLASALLDAGRPEEAEPLLRSLLAAPYDLGSEHARTPGRLRVLGTCLAALGQYEEAAQWLEQAVERAEAILGAQDRETAAAREALARVLDAAGEH